MAQEAFDQAKKSTLKDLEAQLSALLSGGTQGLAQSELARIAHNLLDEGCRLDQENQELKKARRVELENQKVQKTSRRGHENQGVQKATRRGQENLQDRKTGQSDSNPQPGSEACGDDVYQRIFECSFGSNAILEKVPGVSYSRGWVIRAVNPRLAGFVGSSPAELNGKYIQDVLPGQDNLDQDLALADRVLETGSSFDYFGTLKSTGWNFHAHLVPLGNNQVAFIGMDMTSKLQLEEEQRILQVLSENIPEGVAIADSKAGVVRMVSRYGREQAGLPDAMLVNLPLDEIPSYWHVSDPLSGAMMTAAEIPIVRSARNGEVIRNQEMVLENPNGEKIDISVYSVPVIDDGGNITGAVSAWQDITERKQHASEQENLIDQLRLEQAKSAALAAESQEKAEDLETIINSITDAVIIFREGKSVKLNPAAVRGYGADVAGTDIEELRDVLQVRDEHGNPMTAEDVPSQRAMHGETVRDVPIRFTDLRGSEHLIRASSAPLHKEGHIIGSVTTWHDVTEREALAGQLAEERNRLETILYCAPDGIFVVDKDNQVLYSNPAADRLRRNPLAPEKSDPGLNEFQICDPQGSPFPAEEIPIQRALLKGETTINQEMLYVWPDGGKRPVLVSTSPVKDAEGKIRGAVQVFQDISARKAAEKALRDSQQLYRKMGESLPYGVWYADEAGRPKYLSPSFLELLGLSLDEARDNGWLQRLVPQDQENIRADWEQALRAGERIDHEFHVTAPDGSTITILSRGLPVKDHDGCITGWAGINLDVTGLHKLASHVDRQAVQVELQHRLIYQREQERLKIAQELHDGPIQEIYGILYSLRALEDEMKGRQALVELRNVESGLVELSQGLREFCNELRPPSLGAFGLDGAIQSQADSLRSRYPTIRFYLALDEENLALKPEVRLGLFRVCQELLNNAARHAQARHVMVKLHVDAHQIQLEVRDDGTGFEVPSSWVELARQGHLGLVGVQERVDAVGGKLDISSTPGQGTCVSVKVDLTLK